MPRSTVMESKRPEEPRRVSTGALAEGKSALGRGAWDEARRIFESILQTEPERADALEGLGWALYWLDEAEPSFEVREKAYRIFQDRGDARAAARVAINLALDYADFRGMAVTAGWIERARRLLEDEERGPEHGWLALWEGHLARAIEHDLEKALRLAREAQDCAREHKIHDLALLSRALEGLIRVTGGEVTEGMRQLDEATAAAVAGEFSDLDSVAATCCFLAHACERVWDYDRAAQWGERIDAFARRWRIGSLFALCQSEHAAMKIGRGDWQEAEEALLDAIAVLEAKRPLLAPEALTVLAELRRRQGRLDEAEAMFRSVGPLSGALLGLAAIAYERGDAETALDYLERLRLRAMAEKWMERVAALELRVRASLSCGSNEAAAQAARELKEVVRLVGTDSVKAFYALSTGLFRAAAGDHAEARGSLEDALQLFERCGAMFEAARARLDLAQTLIPLGRRTFAIEEMKAARDVFQRLGAATELKRCESMLAREGEGPRDRPRLTRREIEVLRLVAQGMSDKEIAGSLGLSEHTIHRHVSNILTKLELPSRAAAVAEAVQSGLL